MDIEDRLLRGAIELHAHGYPEFSLRLRGRVHDIEWAQLARDAGMRAIVIKSQVFPTVERASLVRKVVPGIEVFGGITLNHPMGGLNPLSVEVAGELGGKVVWMPTWSSKNDLSKSQFYLRRMKAYLSTLSQVVPGPEAGLEILEGGKVEADRERDRSNCTRPSNDYLQRSYFYSGKPGPGGRVHERGRFLSLGPPVQPICGGIHG